MSSANDRPPSEKARREMDPLVQFILGGFLIAAFCALAWLKMGGR